MHARPHIIRLRQPWEVATQAASPETERVSLRRWFHRPTGLDERCCVTLVIEGLEEHPAVILNAAPIPGKQASPGQWRGHLPGDLPLRCVLQIELEMPSPCDLSVLERDLLAAGKVWLEISRRADPH